MADDSHAGERSGTDSGSYVVVARRYRPATFDELIGQQHVAQALKSAIETNRVGHAYLFTGARGVGKTSAARILAKALNCERGPTPRPCNQCDICRSVAAGEDVDVLEIDGASNRGIDEIRQLRQNAGVRPSRARYKIYIIDEVHMLTKEAFNALLKTLEEPPEHVKFIFATTEPNKIPITILSRCQRYDFAGIEATQIETRLAEIAEREGVEVDGEALHILARRAAGSMRDSQSLLEQLLALGKESIAASDVHALLGSAPEARVKQLVGCLVERQGGAALEELDAALAQGVEAAALVDQLLGYFRDLMAAAVGCGEKQMLYVMPSELPEIKQEATQLGVQTILAMLEILEEAATRMRASMHARTVAEMAIVRLAALEQLDELAGLIEGLRSGDGAAASNSRKTPASGRAAEKKNVAAANPPAAAVSAGRAASEPATPSTSSTPVRADAAHSTPSRPLRPDTAETVWREVLSQVSDLVSDHAGLAVTAANPAPNCLAVSFPARYTSAKEFCELPDQRAKLEAAARSVAGAETRLEFSVALDPAEAETKEAELPRSVAKRKLKAEVVERPFVKQALELFPDDQPRVEGPVTDS